MLRLISERTIAERAHAKLKASFQRGAARTTQTLSTPGGQIPDASVLVRRDLDLWAHFGSKPDRRGLLLCWFGVGEPTWQPSIEINIPVRRTLYCYGQLAVDADGNTYVLHKGGLGGGKFTVAPGPFGDLIEGFEREPIEDEKQQREFYVLGRVDRSARLLQQISEFVHEARRIRELRRNERRFAIELKRVGGAIRKGKAIGGQEYKDEKVGRGSYTVEREVQFDRIHGRVQRALAGELSKRRLKYGNRRQKHGLGPDLYVKDPSGRTTHLFEIKVGQDSQTTFTALGQLLVYSADENPPPACTLVTRGLPRSPQFQKAIAKQSIQVLRYSFDGRRISFQDLDSIL
ncbi:MAG TPA: hypothetical protein VFB45_05395 [Pseudolabrys sp.]|nr:hypothetical protein [Pseudolabrys sp.]